MIICPLRHGIISTVVVKISAKCRLCVCACFLLIKQKHKILVLDKYMCDNISTNQSKVLSKKVGNILPRLYMLFSSFSFALNPGTRYIPSLVNAARGGLIRKYARMFMIKFQTRHGKILCKFRNILSISIAPVTSDDF